MKAKDAIEATVKWALFAVAIVMALVTLGLLVGYGWLMVFPAFQMATGDTILGKSMGFPAFGQFGDSFGVVTAVATTGALIMLFFAYWQQQSEFKQVRHAMDRQATIDAIFNMCNLYANILRETVAHVRDSSEAFEAGGNQTMAALGRNGLGAVIRDIMYEVTEFCTMKASDPYSKSEEYEALLRIAVEKFVPYEGCFRILHNIFKYIYERQDLSDNDKRSYARMVRSMLSNNELEALLINCLTERGDKMRGYVEEYAVLHNLPPDGVAIRSDMNKMLRGRYRPSAFTDGRSEERIQQG